jgi:hypothetical protein
MGKDDSIQCRHEVDQEAISRVKRLLRHLPEDDPAALARAGVSEEDYETAFQSAVQSIRGTFAATMTTKRRFYEAVLDHMRAGGHIQDWEFVGTGRSQDYRVVMPGGYEVGIEAKGCPDGNNIRIWSRPTWAREFIIWSQCPDSLQHNPGHGITSGISRLFRKDLIEGERIDAFVFFDGRCGSAVRRCPKRFGVEGALRERASDSPGQREGWLPPPCIYLFPSTTPHALSNRDPVPNDLSSCRFANAALAAFNVPDAERRANVHWARCALDQRPDGTYRQFRTGWGLDNDEPTFQSGWQKITSE